MTSKALITELYVGYFDRAPDPEGLTFWINVLENDLPLEAIAKDFATQPEARGTYTFLDDLQTESPDTNETSMLGTDVEDFIEAIYENLFDREPDAAGLAFWADVLRDGFDPGSFILAIIEGASPADEAILANKVDVACAWSDLAALETGFVLTDAYIDGSGAALAAVNGEASSVQPGKDAAALFFQDAPTVALSGTTTTLAEDVDLTAALKVADIVVTDDALGTNVLALTGDDAALFEIVGTELFLKAGSVTDFETNPSLDVTVTVDDDTIGTTPDDSADLSIVLTNVNDAPTVALANALSSVAENTDMSAALKVADIVVTDDALGSSALALTGADAALFEIVGTELFLKAGTVLDFETTTGFDVSVTVDDPTLGTGIDDTATLTLAVGDVNEAPSVSLANTVSTVAEDLDLTNAVKVADIVVSDDALGSNVLTLSGTDAALFTIFGTDLMLRAGAALDFETNPVLDVVVNIDDTTLGSVFEDNAALSITVMDVNDAPAVALVSTLSSLAEDADTSSALKVADIVVTDDAQGTNTLGLAGDDAALFEIVGTELFLKAGTALDFEANAALDVSVTVDDATIGTGPDNSADLSIAVGDVNEAPTVSLTPAVTALSENQNTATRIKVADIVVADDALGTNTLALTGADAALFEIDGSELFLKAGTVLDFDTDTSLDVTVTVDDASLGTLPDDTASLSVAITDNNQVPQVALSNLVTTLAEDVDTASPVKVADIVVTDDATGNNVLGLSGADAALFEIVGTELFLKAGTTLDFETQAALDVTVSVDDTTIGSLAEDTVTASISVTDVNEIPSVSLTPVITALSEGASTSARIKVADIVVTDDALGTNTLALTGNDAALFEITGSELFLKAGTALDFETNPSLDVAVTIDDPTIGGSPDTTAPLALPVLDVNEVPSVSLTGLDTSILEGTDTSSRVQVASIVVEDDGTGTNTLTLSGADAALFEIDGTGLFLKAGTVLSIANNPVLDVSVSVDDATLGGTPDDTVALSLTVAPGAPGLATDATDEINFTGGSSSTVRAGQIEVADTDPNTAGNQPGFILNTDGNDVPYAGVAGQTLNLIDTTSHDGLVSLGTIAVVESDGVNADNEGFLIDNTNSPGSVEAWIGQGNVFGTPQTPELGATGEWTFDNTGATGTMDIILKEVTLNAGGLMNFRNVNISVEEDLDFTVLGSGLSIDADSEVAVADGVTLTLTVEQVDALDTAGVTVFGAGSVVVTGISGEDGTSATDAIDTDFGNLRTAVVDLSAVTLSTADSDGDIDIMVAGATSDASGTDLVVNGQRVAQHIIGTAANDDVIVASSATDTNTATLDVILELGDDAGDIGDPLITMGDPAELVGDAINLDPTFAEVQIVADAGFDAVDGAFGISDQVRIEVAAGAEFYAPLLIGDYTATADELNNGGVAVLELGSTTADQAIDMSAAGGSAGWTLIGQGAAAQNSHLIGSDQDDVIVAGDTVQTTAAAADLLTGNDGADLFVFGVGFTNPTQPAVAQTVAPVDNETLNYTADDADNNNEALDITIRINGFAQVVNVDLANIDPTVEAEVETAVASALNALADISASVAGGEVLISAQNGASVEYISSAATGTVDSVGGSANELDATPGEPIAPNADQAQVVTVTLPSAPIQIGEISSITVTLPNGTTIGGQTTAGPTSTPATLATALGANLTAADTNNVLSVGVSGQTVTVTATTPDNGGFVVTAATNPSVDGTGASVLGATDLESADIITDFVSGEDRIELNAVAGAGTVANYAERAANAPEAANFATALSEAQTAINGTVAYYFTTSLGTTTYAADSAGGLLNGGAGTITDQGLLFYDADSNGTVDGVVHLVGLGLTDFEATDIV